MRPVDEQMALIAKGTEEILPEAEFRKKLERSVAENRPLRIKMGFDPSAPDIHLGHAVGLRKLRTFQELGHTIVLIVGDFTGMIGDPTGRKETRPRLTRDQIEAHAKTYLDQFFKILDRENTEVHRNGEWFAKMGFEEIMELAARFTVARLLERDDFEKRYKAGEPISLHEFFYPIMQGWDSVEIRSDLEMGGTEQKFNLLVGRNLQEANGQEGQCILTMPILEGVDGVQRMSKSLGNYIGIDEPPREMFGKVMSIPDTLIHRYYTLCTDAAPDELERIAAELAAPGANPRDRKAALGRRIVGLYHGEEAGQAASDEFDRMFRAGEAPDDMPEVAVAAEDGGAWIVKVLAEAGLVKSNGEARRMIKQNAVKVDGDRVSDENLALSVRSEPYQVQVGRRSWARVTVS
jgi:tyrosyl-tRNA synthetase